jgi:hypothetical protein
MIIIGDPAGDALAVQLALKLLYNRPRRGKPRRIATNA